MVKPEILVVDDEVSVRSVLVQVLEKYGYAVTEAADGEQALERLEEKNFALVITDIKMPGASGLEVLKKTKQSYPDTQVIIITSHASLDNAVEALRFGAYDYLFKPFEDLTLISAAAGRAIETVRLTEENRRLLKTLKKQNRQLERTNKILEDVACRDGLTGLFNHRYFQDFLRSEIDRCQRDNDIFSLIFFDLDHFKFYNDSHGHLEGDYLLRQLATLLEKNFRHSDVVSRYGGEEFVVILPGTSKKDAQHLAENMRCFIEGFPFNGRDTQPSGKLTSSVGVATYPEDGNNRTELVQSADNAMYQAKKSGRNGVCVA
jgi:diguanylate cyclase (GGDEF)-like protein